MKRLMAYILMAALLCVTTGVSAEYVGSYDTASQTISVTGPAPAGTDAVIVYLAYDNEDTISATNPPIISVLSEVNDDMVSVEIPCNEVAGKYLLVVGDGSAQAQSQPIIIWDYTDPAAIAALGELNALQLSDIASFTNVATNSDYVATMESVGINITDETYGTDILKVLVNIRPETGYVLVDDPASESDLTISNSWSYGKFATNIAKNVMSVDAAMMAYSVSALGCTYADYLAAKSEANVDAFIARGSLSKQKLTIDQITKLAKIGCAASKGALETAVTVNAAEFDVNMASGSQYSRIPATSRYLVWEKMYRERETILVPSDVTTLFDTAVTAVLDDLNNPGGNVGGNVGGGNVGGGIAGGGYQASTTTSELQSGSIFTDINNHWGKDAIEKLAKKGIINGYEDKSFKPDDTISRAELAKILANAFKITSAGGVTFGDVNSGDWFYSSVMALAGAGIIQGSDGMFNPNSPVTREDTAVMISRMLANDGTVLEGAYVFADADSISDYAKEAVGALAENGLLKGDGQSFFPKNSLTRAEAATFIARIIEIYGGAA